MTLKASVANVIVKINIDKGFNNIINLIKNFSESKQGTLLTINITKSKNRSVKLSDDFNQLIIKGDDINNLSNPYNIIGLLQAIFRFVSIHSLKNNTLLLHASASILSDKAFCFADDGINTGKSISSIECAFESKKYLGDEFCFLDLNTYNVFSYRFIPIHFRADTKSHFEKKHNFAFPKTEYQENNAGYFINPDNIFTVIDSHKLAAFVFPQFNNTNDKLELLDPKNSKNCIGMTLASHTIKMMYPEYDRMNFVTNKDKKLVKSIDESILEDTISLLSLENSIDNIIKKVPCYRALMTSPCSIISLLNNVPIKSS